MAIFMASRYVRSSSS